MRADPLAPIEAPQSRHAHQGAAQIWRSVAVCCPVVLLYLIFSSFSIRDSFMDDETWEFYASKTLAEGGIPLRVTGETNEFHPHLYYWVLAQFMRWFGAHEVGARLLGIVSTLLTALALLRILQRLTGRLDPLSCFLATAFYLLAPVVIQGALIITADTALQHLMVTLILLYVVERQPLRRFDFAVLALLFAVAFWIKFVTPCILLAGIHFHYLLRRDWRGAALIAVAAGGGGFLLFFLTWWGYCSARGLEPTAMFAYLAQVIGSRGQGQSISGKGLLLARMSLIVLFWIGVPCALLMLRALWQRQRLIAVTSTMMGLFLVTGTLFALIFSIAGGVAFGYPRYHFAMFPLWAVVLAAYVSYAFREARLSWRPILGAGALTFLFAFFAGGDPLYALLFQLKISTLAFPEIASPSIAAVAGTLLIAAAPLCVAVLAARRWRSAVHTTALVACVALASQLAQACLQARADYHTGLAYGETGSETVHRYCRDRLSPCGRVVGGKDVIYHTVDCAYMDDWRWSDKPYLLARLGDPRTQFLVMGIQHNTIEQLRAMREDADFRGVLEERYRSVLIGSYFIWERMAMGKRTTACIAE